MPPVLVKEQEVVQIPFITILEQLNDRVNKLESRFEKWVQKGNEGVTMAELKTQCKTIEGRMMYQSARESEKSSVNCRIWANQFFELFEKARRSDGA